MLHIEPSSGSTTGISACEEKRGDKEMGLKNLNLLRRAASAESNWINQSISSWQEESSARRCQPKSGKDALQSVSRVPSTKTASPTGLAEEKQWGKSCSNTDCVRIITTGKMRGAFRDTKAVFRSSSSTQYTYTAPTMWGFFSRTCAGPDTEWMLMGHGHHHRVANRPSLDTYSSCVVQAHAQSWETSWDHCAAALQREKSYLGQPF